MQSTNSPSPGPTDARPTVLFTPLSFNLAETTRMIEVARSLPETLRAAFLAHDDRYLHLISEAGFPLLPSAPSFTRAQQEQVIAFDQGRSLRHPFTRQVLERRVRAEREAIQEQRAVAVVHGTNPTSAISARAEQVPLFYPVPYVWSRPQLASGTTLPLLPPGRGASLNRLLTRPAGWIFSRAPLAPPSFREVARNHGVREVRSILDLLAADVTLLTAMADEIGETPLPASMHRVGPIYARLPGDVPETVRELAAGPRPVVYLACGSSGTPGLVRDAITALSDLPVEVVAPVSDYLSPDDLASLPDNVTVTDLLPTHRLSGLVDAAVLHGGQGTVQAACATGVPFIGIGMSAEQRWNVQISERRGNAVEVARHHLRGRAPVVKQAVRRILFDPDIRATADEVRREHAREDGAVRSAEVIAQHVAA